MFGYNEANRPNFVARQSMLSSSNDDWEDRRRPAPCFFVAATDDGLGLAPHSAGFVQAPAGK